MGSKRKQMRFQDEIEWMNRRSSRIIALEEKRHKEIERKLALALERKNNLVNHYKEKGKATMKVPDDLSDFSKDVEGPTKKGHKSKQLYQLISSIKELERHYENTSTSGTNDSSLNDMPLRSILQIITDFLQREDPDELFAQPINLDVVEKYHEIIKQPMDFGTIRAKIHEGLYTNLEQFKRDVFLMFSNAMNVNPATSKYHQVAEDISRDAKWIFEAFPNPYHFNSKLFLDKRSPTRKPQNEQLGTSQKVSPKEIGRNNATHVMVPKTEKRHMYWPPSKPLTTEVPCSNNPNILLNTNSIKYKESLLRFVEDLGPTAKRVAAKKLEALRDQQLCNVDSPTPQTQSATLNAQTLALALPFLNRSLTIPSSATQGNRIFNNNNVGKINIRDGPYQGNKTYTNDRWNAYVATLLSNRFFNNDKGDSSSGRVESSNNLFPYVYPAHVISRPSMNLPESSIASQSRPRNLMSSMPSNNLSQFSLAREPRQEDIVNLSDLSLVSQPRPQNFMSCMPSNNLTQFSRAHELRPKDFVKLSDLFLVSQPRPRDSMYRMPNNNPTEPSLVYHPWQANSMYCLNPTSVSTLPLPNQGMSVSTLPQRYGQVMNRSCTIMHLTLHLTCKCSVL
ncbi:Bromodomain and PHD finger-containing protein 3 [Glycine soja]